MDYSGAITGPNKLGHDVYLTESALASSSTKELGKLRRQSMMWKRVAFIMFFLLGSVLIILLLAVMGILSVLEKPTKQLSTDLKTLLAARTEGSKAPFSTSPLDHLVKWETVLFEPLNDTQADFAWECLPNGNGLVYLDEDIQGEYNLPRGLPDGSGGTSLYGISWTHQLYCLAILRTALTDALAVSVSHSPSEVDRFLDCFEYLRTKISCNPDLTIEYPTSGEPIVDGWGMHHQCAQRVS